MRSVFYILLMGLVSGCVGDAPRDNPLDPGSDSYVPKGSIRGRIVLMAGTSAVGIPSVSVWYSTAGFAVTTDSAGYFILSDLPEGTHLLIASKANYTPDTFQVTVRGTWGADVVRALNAAPVTTFRQILTRKIDQYFPSPQYFVDVTATVTDPNGLVEVDSVWFSVDSLRYPMTYSLTTKNFHATIYKYDVPTNSIQWLVGRPLTIIARDQKMAVSISEPFMVTRVIENEASPLYPSSVNNDSVRTDSLSFRWSPPVVTYHYSYTLTLSRVETGTQTVVWTLPGIDSFYEEFEFFSHPGRPVLTPGNYVWTITVVDDFGNYGRSKEAAFVLK